MFSAVPFLIFIVFAILTMIFVTSLVKGIGQYLKNSSIPEEHVPARLVAKRMHNWGGHGNLAKHTSYFVTFETAEGERLEFPAGSTFWGLHAEGETGILTYRGTKFIDFEKAHT